MTAAPDMRVLYRATRTNPPTVRDFLSNEARGRRIPPNATEEMCRRWDGLSMWNDRGRLRRVAQNTPGVGSFIAQLHIPTGSGITVEPFTDDPNHFTVRGDAVALLGMVRSVAPV